MVRRKLVEPGEQTIETRQPVHQVSIQFLVGRGEFGGGILVQLLSHS